MLLQVLRDGGELLQRRFQVVRDLLGNQLRRRQIGGLFEGVILQPEDVEVYLVALGQLVVGKGSEAFALLAVGAVLRAVAGDEVIQIAAFQGVFREREMQVGSQVVDPEPLNRPKNY